MSSAANNVDKDSPDDDAATVEAAAAATAAVVVPVLAHAAAATAPLPTAALPADVSAVNKKKRKRKRSGNVFNDMLYELLLFRSQKGHTRVPLKHGGGLGRWVSQLRQQHAQKQNNSTTSTTSVLTSDRIQVLDSIGFVWHVPQHDHEERWNRHYQGLVAYRQANGHANVPQSCELGKWVKTQRENYRRQEQIGNRKSGSPYLSQERIHLLNQIQFQWNINPPAVGWEGRFQELMAYMDKHGNPHVPQGYKDNVPLGRWVMKQRSQYSLKRRGKKHQLTSERIQRLEALGFQWTCNKSNKSEQQTETRTEV